jgi:hypothetical protein
MISHCIKTKTFSFGATIKGRTFFHWSLSTASMPKGVKPFSEADKRAAIELWKDEEPLPYQPGAVEELDPEAVGHQDGGFCLP